MTPTVWSTPNDGVDDDDDIRSANVLAVIDIAGLLQPKAII